MKTIKIKDYYGIYQEIPVSDELYEEWRALQNETQRVHRKEVYHRDWTPIEDLFEMPKSYEQNPMEDTLLWDEQVAALYAAIAQLTPIQQRRIHMLMENNAMSNKKFGYARVSTAEQNEDRQVLELLEYGIEERDIYVDKQSGRSFERTNYMSLRNSILRNGDILVVKSIDRFGRNYSGIRAEWEYLTKTLGVDIVVLDTPILDTTRYKDLLGSVITDIVLAVLSFGAQLEVDTKSKAQAEGIAAAHLKGVKFGRPKCSVKDWDIYYPKWKQGKITAVECYRQLGVSASTFYRLVHEFESEGKAR